MYNHGLLVITTMYNMHMLTEGIWKITDYLYR